MTDEYRDGRGGSQPWHELARRDDYPADDRINRTYSLTRALDERLKATALAHQVGVSDLVRYLLTQSLDQVDGGALPIPTRPARLHIIDG